MTVQQGWLYAGSMEEHPVGAGLGKLIVKPTQGFIEHTSSVGCERRVRCLLLIAPVTIPV